MTPNKLPPLPEPAVKSFKPATHDTAGHSIYTFSADQMHAYAAEALRQSQSLPAGAVDEADAWQREWDKEILLNLELLLRPRKWLGRWDEVVRQLLAEFDALQADAREKGEAPEEVETVIGRLYAAARHVDRARGKLPDSFNHQEHNDILDAITLIRRLATQPAQASEKDNG